MFRVQSQRHGFKLRTEPRGSPLNIGDSFQASHPVIRTNPVTGWKGLYINGTFTSYVLHKLPFNLNLAFMLLIILSLVINSRIDQLSFDESSALLSYLFTLQNQAHDAQVRYRWSVNDLAIWDNRSTTHVATFDYEELRVGDRVVCVGETPYFDKHSRSKKEALEESAGKA